MAEGGAVLDGRDDEAGRLLHRSVARARLTLIWERLWPRLVLPAGVVGLYAVVAWFSLFQMLPRWLDLGLLGLFALALIAALVPLARIRVPSTAEALRRLDAAAPGQHRPASALGDRLAATSDDSVAQALWAAHRRESARRAQNLVLGLPAPGLAGRDPFAIRIALILALIVAGLYAGDDRFHLFFSPLSPARGVATAAAVRIDAWVTPPAYTRRPPVMLTGTGTTVPLAVPQGSVVVVRVAGDPAAVINATGLTSDASATGPAAASGAPDGVVERRLKLNGDASLTVKSGDASAATYSFSIIPDSAPIIAFDGPIKEAARGAMTLSYKATDDYGVASVEASIDLMGKAGARPLFTPPTIPLIAPGGRERSGTASATRDVSDNPFAGALVTMTLVAKDDAGNEGRSAPLQTLLPGRVFIKPLARALIEQRRDLALDAGRVEHVEAALDALMIAPDVFTKDFGVYLGLRTARTRLDMAKSDDDLRSVVQYLWQIALDIEDGNLSGAERDLKDAQQQLRDALERGASPEEIQRLTQNLRAALDKFLQEYAARQDAARRNGEPQPQMRSPDQRVITPKDLNALIDRMQEMMKGGDRDQAQQLLSQLNNLLENLQSPDQGEVAEDPGTKQMEQSLSDLGDMIRKQQTLRDQTFQQARPANPDQGQNGQDQSDQNQGDQSGNDQQGDGDQQGLNDPGSGQSQDNQQGGGQNGTMKGGNGPGLGALQQRQQALRGALAEMQRKLRDLGVPGGDGLGQAEQAMRDAEGKLGKGDGTGAVDSQEQALEGLRKGAQSLAQQLQAGGSPGSGQPGQAQRTGEGTGNGDDRDPLGRPTRSRGYADGDTKVPGRGETAVERAARVLGELRRRYADPSRSQQELDYIGRLLKPN